MQTQQNTIPPTFSLLHGDCLEKLATLRDNSIDAVVTDPPYGLGEAPDALAMLRDWLETGHHEVKSKRGFMGKAWDNFVPQPRVWHEVFRVLKPGGHVLAFAGTRTQDLMALGLRLAGFEIRDLVAWVYGSGFPKSHNLEGDWKGWGTSLKPAFESLTYATKPLDCLGHCAKMIENLNEKIKLCRQSANSAEKSLRLSQADSQEERTSTAPENAATRTEGAGVGKMGIGAGGVTNSKADTSESTSEGGDTALNTLLSWRSTLEGAFAVMKMSTTATAFETITDWKILNYCLSQTTHDTITKARSNPNGLNADALRAVEYLSASLACCESTLALSALAPAMLREAESCRGAGVSPNLEPITLARKPLEGTVAANMLKWHTGAINVDACRVHADDAKEGRERHGGGAKFAEGSSGFNQDAITTSPAGRWPANLIHDGSEEVVGLFPDTGKSTGGRTVKRSGGGNVGSGKASEASWTNDDPGYGDSGSAARFFYCAKVSPSERNAGLSDLPDKEWKADGAAIPQRADRPFKPSKNNHPTVKPLALMRYLCRLITPPSGTILDPYLGSGSTGVAALQEGFDFIGIEREEEYFTIAIARIDNALKTHAP